MEIKRASLIPKGRLWDFLFFHWWPFHVFGLFSLTRSTSGSKLSRFESTAYSKREEEGYLLQAAIKTQV